MLLFLYIKLKCFFNCTVCQVMFLTSWRFSRKYFEAFPYLPKKIKNNKVLQFNQIYFLHEYLQQQLNEHRTLPTLLQRRLRSFQYI